MISRKKINKLRFSEDGRGLVVRLLYFPLQIKTNCFQNCVDVKKNRLGVCCLERSALSLFSSPPRRIRQDDVQVKNFCCEYFKT